MLRSKLPASRRSDLSEDAALRDLVVECEGIAMINRHRLDRSSTMVIAAYYTAVLRFPHRARPRIGPKGSPVVSRVNADLT